MLTLFCFAGGEAGGGGGTRAGRASVAAKRAA